MKVKLKNVRIAFIQALFEAKKFGDDDTGESAYGSTFVFPGDHPVFKDINDAIEAVAAEKWENKAPEILKQLRTADRVCLHDGNTKPDYMGFPGNFFVAARNKAKPLVVDNVVDPEEKKLNPESKKPRIIKASDGRIYAGCYVNVTLDIWAMQNKYGKRVNATLSGVQFWADGDAFSGAPPATLEDFGDLVDGADASDLV